MSLNSATEAASVSAPWSSAGSGQCRRRLAVYWVQPSADCIGIQVPAHRTLLRNGFRLTVGCISHRPPLAATVT
ncbi:MAG TPA: hypothetical protein VKP30_23625, partial [Polyangiaceae bacterium]|nr:hypothetical protein [Polyangiaceae bacterium]